MRYWHKGAAGLVVCVVGLAAFVHAQDAGSPPDPLVAVAPLVAANQTANALRTLDVLPQALRSSASARYLRARLLERLTRYSEAADSLTGAFDGVPSEIAEDIAKRRIVLLAMAARCDEALTQGAALRNPSSEVDARMAECALRMRNYALALTRIESAIRDVRARAAVPYRLTRADILLAQGQRDRAIRELRGVLLEQPAHPRADDAAQKLATLHATPTWTMAEHLDRAEAFSAARQHGRAVEELRQLAAPRDRALKARFLHVKGMALFGTRRNYEEASRVLAEAARLPSATALSDEFHAARALARSDREPAAIRAYRRFARAHSADEHAPEAAYLAALSLLRSGSDEGVREMNRFLRGPFAARAEEFVREGNAQLAFFQFARGRFVDAARAFTNFADEGTGGMVKGRGHYWAARSLVLANQRERGIASYRSAVAAEPLHWYALLAHARLVELGEDAPPFAAQPTINATPTTPPRVRLPEAARFYASLGLRQDARALVRARESSLRAQAPNGREIEALVAIYDELGDADRTYHLTAGMREALSRPIGPDNAWVWHAAYPRPWQDIVDSEARARNVPEDYLYAIMRQESGYDPDVVSIADAIGLLQLLPSTASRVAEGINERADRQDLFDPRINIHLSAVYTGNLYRTFSQQAPLSIGAYNAGAPRMQRWVSTSTTDELDLFVERIAVDQTRNYIRRVMSHWARYRYMRNPSAGWPMQLPLRIDRSRIDAASAHADR
ncbi:MAG: lytic transglycosylase domain-containing protein [Sandaracinaceae bacterium]|nr:lytic transglycosylase domain-containing protein [Sandaracinaceae bacterium]